MELKDLVGAHLLSGVDRGIVPGQSGDPDIDPAETFRFCLDGVTYVATEDPNDGWRSSMAEIRVDHSPISNRFAPTRVVCRMRANDHEEHDVLQILHADTGALIVEVGTENTGDYYPSFACRFEPASLGAP